MSLQIGKEAPEFSAIAYHRGKTERVRLTDYRGFWVLLFFYPADFTCV